MRRLLLLAAVAALSACGGVRPHLGPAEQRTERVHATPSYILGSHRDAGFALEVTNRSRRQVDVAFHVVIPASHPRSRAPGLPDSGEREKCSGVQRRAVLEPRETIRFESCFFSEVARSEAYGAVLVIRGVDGRVLETLRFTLDLPAAVGR